MSRKNIAALVAATAAAALLITGCSPADVANNSGGSAAGGETTKVTLQIDGAAVPYYAPLYEAVEQGYFADEGIDVEFTYAEGSAILQNVAAGNVQFGFPNGDSVITAKAKGVDVDIVHTTYQQGIGAILFNKDTAGITSPADLAGKRIAVTDLGSPNYIQLQAILQSAGLTVNDVQVSTVGSGAIVQALQNGEVDAIAFSRIRYYALQAAGFPVGQILSDEYLPSFGNVLVTSPSFRESKPEVVRGFVSALDKGIEYVIAHPADSVAQVIPAYADTFAGQEKTVTDVIQNVFIPDLWTSDATKANGLGYGDLDRWQASIDNQAEYGIIPKAFDASDLVVEPGDL
ncbi:ABC transporter substrate-binding protein [Microbacterium sp. SORGH_AS_0862]|uniref:ABC transporter substrate-binding protein n=1 Tax=Microbacterium sp. SORGH_AS_0862 TaxID=3041789 RepID=UPI002794C1F9|nr:ABC transporter substrate-binding protein [Microbacterium sp. SORGH_AS_0862]MDQ1205277.1 NitT/TauT family transport system substrate-binding protein [Microbacterium sp. SORGH_AS_0862]